jgi:hypothetical protein
VTHNILFYFIWSPQAPNLRAKTNEPTILW